MSEKKSESRTLSRVYKVLAIIVILLLGIIGMRLLKKNGPVADKVAPQRVIPIVRTITAKSGSEQLYVVTQGRVEPLRRTQAASEVMGRVIMVSPKFKVGGIFNRNEIMLEIDDADYVSALAAAESSLADAQLVLAQETARAEQALRDWKKLGRGEPSELVARKPQISSAKARIFASQAGVEKATRDLDRTKLRAPYDCRVEATYTDLGSYITPGARLADLYSTDAFEVRVPVTLEEIGYLKKENIIGSEVITTATIGNEKLIWKGKIVRSEGLVDRNTMTQYFVVGIEPNNESTPYNLPPSGLFVRADVKGMVMEKVTVIPRSALRADNTLLTITPENKLEIIPVKVARTLGKTVIISSGLSDGTRVITSPMETPVRGMQLKLEEKNSEQPQEANSKP